MADLVVLVCGSRDCERIEDVRLVFDTLAAMAPKPDAVVTGGCPNPANTLRSSVDMAAKTWAFDNGVPYIEVCAQWDFYKRPAGPIRNSWMLRFVRPTLVLAFPGNRGTADMVKQAKDAGIEVREVSP